MIEDYVFTYAGETGFSIVDVWAPNEAVVDISIELVRLIPDPMRTFQLP